jgi:hypothetical protein
VISGIVSSSLVTLGRKIQNYLVQDEEKEAKSSRLATAHESGIQAASTNGVLLADPRDESLKPQPVSAMRGRAVSRSR